MNSDSEPDNTPDSLAELMERRRVLEAQLLELRRVGTHKTRARAHERAKQSMEELDKAIVEVRSELRHAIATINAPLSPTRLGVLGGLLYARDNVEAVLHEDVDREPWWGEVDPWVDDAVNRRAVIEREIAELTDEIEVQMLAGQATALERKREGILARIAGRS